MAPSSPMTAKDYRPCVVGVFFRPDGRILTGKRADFGSFQLPQGGIDPEETPLEALYREMQEELGVAEFTIARGPVGPVRYDFPQDLPAAMAKRYCGQEQFWYGCTLPSGSIPDLQKATSDEFTELKWLTVVECLAEIPAWKYEAYIAGLLGLGLY
jgi:putative (di)nucleoside polyphosphate hydrolase